MTWGLSGPMRLYAGCPGDQFKGGYHMQNVKRIVLLVLIVLLAVSCQKKAGEVKSDASVSSGPWTLKTAAEPWKGKTLRMIGEALPPLEALAKLVPQFEAETGVKVVIEQYGQAEVNEKTMADFVGGTKIFDLVLAPHRQLGQYVENGWLLPIDDLMNNPKLKDPNFELTGEKAAFLDEWYWKEVSWYNGKGYGLPFHFITQYLWYRYDLFEHPEEQANFKAKYGYDLPSPPVTIKEYYDVAQFFTRKKGQKLAGKTLENDFFGNTIQAKRHVSAYYVLLNFFYTFGGNIMNQKAGHEYGELVINSPETIQALDFYKSLIPYCPPGVLSYGWDESQAAMQQDLAAMGIEWDDAVGAVENPKESLVAGKIAYSGVPILKDKCIQVEGWSYHIPKGSQKPELAWLFIQWAMGKEQQHAQMAVGGQSSIRAVYDFDDVKQLPYVPTAVYLKTRGKDVLGIRESGSGKNWGIPRTYLEAKNPKTGDTSVDIIAKPKFPEQEEIVEAVVLAMSNALSGQKTSKEALDEAAATIKAALGSKLK